MFYVFTYKISEMIYMFHIHTQFSHAKANQFIAASGEIMRAKHK